MKILLATYWGMPFVGGVETYTLQLKHGLELRGHQVDMFSKLPAGNGYHLTNRGIALDKSRIEPVIRAKVTRYYGKRLPGLDPWILEQEIDRYCYEAAAAYFLAPGYDLIHTQDIISSRAFGRIKSAGTALAATIHGSLALEWFVQTNGSQQALEAFRTTPVWQYVSLREHLGVVSSEATIMPTQWLKQIMVSQFAVPEERMVLAGYGIDIEGFDRRMAEPTDMARPEGKKVIICPARLDAVKGHAHLLRALAGLKAERDDWVCWLVGDGALGDQLRAMSAELGLQEHVHFLGSRGDVAALLRLANIFVLASRQDNHPYAVMEAQVAGKAVVVSNAGGIPEMVNHGQDGLVFQVGDDQALHMCLSSLLQSDELRERLSRAALESGRQRWSLQAMTDRVTAVYDSAIRSRMGRNAR